MERVIDHIVARWRLSILFFVAGVLASSVSVGISLFYGAALDPLRISVQSAFGFGLTGPIILLVQRKMFFGPEPDPVWFTPRWSLYCDRVQKKRIEQWAKDAGVPIRVVWTNELPLIDVSDPHWPDKLEEPNMREYKISFLHRAQMVKARLYG